MKQMEVTMKKIGETNFYITPFPAFTSARISGELASVLAPILGSFGPMVKGADLDNTENIMNENIEEALPIISDALSQLEGEKLEHLMKQLLVDHKNIAYDDEDGETDRLTYEAANELFCGEFQDMILLCWEVIKLNFSGFFKKIAGQSGNLQNFTDMAKKRLKMGKTGMKNGESSI